MMWYSNYGGQSIGRVLHFIESLQGFDMMELALVGDGEITYHGEVVATYTFEHTPESRDVPKFKFIDKYHVAPEVYAWKEKIAISAGMLGQAKYELETLKREYDDHDRAVRLTEEIFRGHIPEETQQKLDKHVAEMNRLYPLVLAAKDRVQYAKDHYYDYIKIERDYALWTQQT